MSENDELTGAIPRADGAASGRRPMPSLPTPNAGTSRGADGDHEASPRAPRRRSSPGPAAASRRGGIVSLYVSPGVQGRFERYRRGDKSRTNAAVMLEAISQQYEQLSEIIERATVSRAPAGGLFPGRPNDVHYVGSGRMTIQVTGISDEQLAVLDQVGDDLGFSSRSTWIAPVLNAWLPGRRDQA